MGYVSSVEVTVPGVAPGAKATLLMRVYDGSLFDSSSVRGQTSPITIAVGGGTLPPAGLVGLSAIQLVGGGTINTPPTISAIADQRAEPNNPTLFVSFSVADNETAAGWLSQTTRSSRALLPGPSLGREAHWSAPIGDCADSMALWV